MRFLSSLLFATMAFGLTESYQPPIWYYSEGPIPCLATAYHWNIFQRGEEHTGVPVSTTSRDANDWFWVGFRQQLTDPQKAEISKLLLGDYGCPFEPPPVSVTGPTTNCFIDDIYEKQDDFMAVTGEYFRMYFVRSTPTGNVDKIVLNYRTGPVVTNLTGKVLTQGEKNKVTSRYSILITCQ